MLTHRVPSVISLIGRNHRSNRGSSSSLAAYLSVLGGDFHIRADASRTSRRYSRDSGNAPRIIMKSMASTFNGTIIPNSRKRRRGAGRLPGGIETDSSLDGSRASNSSDVSYAQSLASGPVESTNRNVSWDRPRPLPGTTGKATSFCPVCGFDEST